MYLDEKTARHQPAPGTAYPNAGTGAVTRGQIIARIERMPGNAMHIRARLLIGLATFFDGFDVIAIAATLPLLIANWSPRRARSAS